MSRRILYDPVQFVEASTPFYENIVGTITDQTDRISRNIELAREEKRIEDDRLWQKSMLDRQLDARRELQEGQHEFQGDQNAMNRHQQNMHHMGNLGLGYAQLGLGYAKLGIEQARALARQQDEEVKAAQQQVDKLYGTIRNVGFIGSSAATRHTVVRHPETNEIVVYDMENRVPLGNFSQYVNNQQPLVNFADQFLDGQNVVKWAEANLARGDTYQDAESGADVVDQQSFLNAVSAIRSGLDDGGGMRTLYDLMDADSGVRLLRKDDRDVDLRDPVEMTLKIQDTTGALTNANNFHYMFDDKDPTRFRSEVRNDPERFMPMLFDATFPNMPDKEFKGQTLGVAEESYLNMRMMFGTSDEIKNVRRGLDNITELARELLNFHPDVIPAELQGVERTILARSLRVNKEEMLRPRPNIRNLFIFPTDAEEAVKVSTRGAQMFRDREDHEQTGIRYGFFPDPKDKKPWE